MKKHKWSARVMLRYSLLQLPAAVALVLILTVVRQWVDIPRWFFWGLVALWVIKDIILYPFVWRAYDGGRSGAAHSIIGMQGVTKDRLEPSGYVRVRGELWQAEIMEGGQPIEKGVNVRIREIRGLILLVEPDKEERTI